MPKVELGLLPTMIGSMPHTDPAAACALVTRHLKDIPAWPQLPRRSPLENMYIQYSEGFPGATVADSSVRVERARDLSKPLEQLYTAYLAKDYNKYPIRREYAAGLHHFLGLDNLLPRAVKGQVTGPVSWGLTVTDEGNRPIIYDDALADAAAKLLRLKAAWEERELSRISRKTIIFLDEPYMSSFGSAFVALSREKVISLLEEVFGGIRGLKGVHCCGNTDWPVLLATSADILSFDAYNYAASLALYPKEVRRFLGDGKAIAWGIVPNTAETLAKETAASLQDRLEEAMTPFTRDGFHFRELVAQGLLTPSCGLEGLTEEMAARTLELLAELSARIRKKYV